MQAGDILGRSPLSIGRLRWRLEHEGYDRLLDRRSQVPSPKRAPVSEVQPLLAVYRERDPGLNGCHFHQLARQHHCFSASATPSRGPFERPASSPSTGPEAATAAEGSAARASANCCTSVAAATTGWP